MCELLAMSCRHPARLTLSLSALARRAHLPSNNQDGWGMAYFQGKDVALYRDISSAAGSPLLNWLVEHGPAARTVMGYIRHGTQGEISLANTGPFLRELNGRMHAFVHNGNLRCSSEFDARSKQRFQAVGETDSERAFCELMTRIASLPSGAEQLPSLDARMQAVAEIAGQFRHCGPSNFIYSDGDVLFVHADQRYQNTLDAIAPPGLHLFECQAQDIAGLVCEAEPPYNANEQKVILLATAPLSDQFWQPMPRGSLLALRNGAIAAKFSL